MALLSRHYCCFHTRLYSFSTAASSKACKDDRYGLAKSPTPTTANPQPRYGWPLDAAAVTSHINYCFIRFRAMA
ncbi:hypothetical protein [Nostoc sp. C052]|uniref:hypothetical protein n=1 Tax=Nostoc sp. C052 TaxID=2576902 RepID=UPI0015C34B67|nr:hypothetical protein [Nostoc sp. C052]